MTCSCAFVLTCTEVGKMPVTRGEGEQPWGRKSGAVLQRLLFIHLLSKPAKPDGERQSKQA